MSDKHACNCVSSEVELDTIFSFLFFMLTYFFFCKSFFGVSTPKPHQLSMRPEWELPNFDSPHCHTDNDSQFLVIGVWGLGNLNILGCCGTLVGGSNQRMVLI